MGERIPSKKEFDEVLRKLEDSVEAIGDTCIGSAKPLLKTPVGDSGKWTGLHCKHGDLEYFVIGHPDREFFEIAYPMDLVSGLAGELGEHQARAHISPEELEELDMPIEQAAAIKILESMDPKDRRALTFHLVDRLSDAMVSFRLLDTEGGALAGFEVKRKIFPRDDGFTLTEFNHSVQAVVSVGHLGSYFIGSTFDLNLEIERTDRGASPLSFRPPRSI